MSETHLNFRGSFLARALSLHVKCLSWGHGHSY